MFAPLRLSSLPPHPPPYFYNLVLESVWFIHANLFPDSYFRKNRKRSSWKKVVSLRGHFQSLPWLVKTWLLFFL